MYTKGTWLTYKNASFDECVSVRVAGCKWFMNWKFELKFKIQSSLVYGK